MIRHIHSDTFGTSQLGWLDSRFHFSFAQYHNPDRMHFGVLRVLNDDLVQAGAGFDTHPHRDYEIISYVIAGELTHADSMNNQRTLTRGQAQYMSAGTGVTHSEHNKAASTLRLIQIWITPDKKGYPPNYGDVAFAWDDRCNRLLPIASGDNDSAFPIQIHADVHFYATLLERGKNQPFAVAKGRQAYLVLIEGKATIGNITMQERDALEITEENCTIQAVEDAHVLVIEMAKE